MQGKHLNNKTSVRLTAIHKLSQNYNRTIKKNHPERLIELIKEHVDEIKQLYGQKNSHCLVETGDLIILCMELLLEMGTSIDKTVEVCLQRYEKKLPSLIRKIAISKSNKSKKPCKSMGRHT